jgi:hypothetical protein
LGAATGGASASSAGWATCGRSGRSGRRRSRAGCAPSGLRTQGAPTRGCFTPWRPRLAHRDTQLPQVAAVSWSMGLGVSLPPTHTHTRRARAGGCVPVGRPARPPRDASRGGLVGPWGQPRDSGAPDRAVDSAPERQNPPLSKGRRQCENACARRVLLQTISGQCRAAAAGLGGAGHRSCCRAEYRRRARFHGVRSLFGTLTRPRQLRRPHRLVGEVACTSDRRAQIS